MEREEIEAKAVEYAVSRGADTDKKAFRTITNRDLYDHTIECFIAGWYQSEQRYPSEATIQLLANYNNWRRGAEIEQPNPLEIGNAIDEVLALFPKVR